MLNKDRVSRILAWVVVIFMVSMTMIRIHYEATDPGVKNWNQKQLEEIDTTKTDFSFAIHGDNQGSVTVFNNLIEAIDEDNVLFSIAIGDLVNSGTKENWRVFLDQIKRSETPLLTVPGNHDIEGDSDLYEQYFGSLYYSFAIGDSYFITIDNSKRDVDSDQLVWLNEQLDVALSYENRFVVMHIPLFNPQSVDDCAHSLGHELAMELNGMFIDHGVTMVLAAHVHGYFQGSCNGMPYVISGGGGELGGNDPDHYFHHYVKVTVSDEGVSYEAKRVDGPDPDEPYQKMWINLNKAISVNYLAIVIIPIMILVEYRYGWIRKTLWKRE